MSASEVDNFIAKTRLCVFISPKRRTNYALSCIYVKASDELATVKRSKDRRKIEEEGYDNGMDFASLNRAAEDRTRWKEVVVKSPVVPMVRNRLD